MAKRVLNKKNQNKVKIKQLVFPIFAACFLFTLIIFGTFNGQLLNLMGNSVINNYICPDGYQLNGNNCVSKIDAILLGDVNNDNLIDASDITLINNHINEEIFLTSQDFKAADVNMDGRITQEDINIINNVINKVSTIKGYVCPDGYTLDNNKCYITKKASKIENGNSYNIGDAVKYNDSYWYVLSDSTNYVTLLKANSLTSDQLGKFAINNNGDYNNIMYYNSSCTDTNCNNYTNSDIKTVLDAYSISIDNDLIEVNGYKIRLITIDELVQLGFSDKSNTLYYEMSDNTPYWIGSNGKEYWVMNSNTNNINNTFMVVDYNNNSYIYENSVNSNLGLVRPVINLKKSAIK